MVWGKARNRPEIAIRNLFSSSRSSVISRTPMAPIRVEHQKLSAPVKSSLVTGPTSATSEAPLNYKSQAMFLPSSELFPAITLSDLRTRFLCGIGPHSVRRQPSIVQVIRLTEKCLERVEVACTRNRAMGLAQHGFTVLRQARGTTGVEHSC
jgi:hypothetical protein